MYVGFKPVFSLINPAVFKPFFNPGEQVNNLFIFVFPTNNNNNNNMNDYYAKICYHTY